MAEYLVHQLELIVRSANVKRLIGGNVRKISIGVIGTNFVTDMFMKGISLVAGFDVTAVCATSEESIARFTSKYPVSQTFHDYRKMADADSVDAVYLAVPNHLHHEMTLYFLNKRVSVLCEKPLAVNPLQVKEMIEASKQNHTLLQDGIVPLYAENYLKLRENLRNVGRLRRAVLAFGRYSSRYDAYLQGKNPPTFRLEYCNGSLLDMGVYCVAVAVSLFGKPVRVLANSSKLLNGVDCMGTAILVYEDFEAVILHSKVADSSIVSEIQGEQGNLYIDSISRMEKVFLQIRNKDRIQVGLTLEDGFQAELLDFRDNLLQGRVESRSVSHQLSYEIVEVLYEIRKQSGVSYPCYGEDISDENS
jgi:predicted dehydrogenase